MATHPQLCKVLGLENLYKEKKKQPHHCFRRMLFLILFQLFFWNKEVKTNKGHCVVWRTEKLNKLLEENKVPRTLFEARKVAGSATCKQSKTIWKCGVLQGQFVYSVYSVVNNRQQREFDYEDFWFCFPNTTHCSFNMQQCKHHLFTSLETFCLW